MEQELKKQMDHLKRQSSPLPKKDTAFNFLVPFSPRERKTMENNVQELRNTLVSTETALLGRIEKSLLEQIALRDSLATISADLEKTISGYKKDLETANTTINKKEEEIINLQANCSQFQRHAVQLEAQTIHLTTKIAALEKEGEEQRQGRALEHEENVRNQTIMKKQEEEYRLLHTKYQHELQSSTELRREKDFLTSENTSLSATVITIEESLEETEKKLYKSNQLNKELRTDRESLSLQLRGTQRQLQDINIEVADIKQKEIWQTMENELSKKEKEKEKKKVNDIVAELDELSLKFQTCVKELDHHKTQQEDMRALNDMLYQENKKILTEKTLLSTKLAAAEDQMEKDAKLALVNEQEWKRQLETLQLENLRKPLPGTVITCDDGHDHYISLASISGLPPPSTYTDDTDGGGGSTTLPPPIGNLPPVAEDTTTNAHHENNGSHFSQENGSGESSRGTQRHGSSDKVYYLACLKCKEWEELQSSSIDTMSRLTEEVARKDIELHAQQQELLAANTRASAIAKEYKDRREEMLVITRKAMKQYGVDI